MAAPYGLLFPGFMGQRFALPMQADLSRLPPDRGRIGGDMPGRDSEGIVIDKQVPRFVAELLGVLPSLGGLHLDGQFRKH